LGGGVSACTLLIPFDDVPLADAGPDALAPDVLVIDAGSDVTADAVSDAKPCKDAADGFYCATQPKLVGYEGDRDDLVTCRMGEIFRVRLCDAGTGCIRMVDPYPDQCDECATKANGTYCGRDMPGWEAMNDNMRVRCGNGALVGILLCAAGCTSNGASSACN
jgi:hypothetical protein